MMMLYRRFKFLFWLLGLWTGVAVAQSTTTVNGTIIDPSGYVWAGALVQPVFTESPGVPGPYTWSGGAFNKTPTGVTADSSGVFSINLQQYNVL